MGVGKINLREESVTKLSGVKERRSKKKENIPREGSNQSRLREVSVTKVQEGETATKGICLKSLTKRRCVKRQEEKAV